VTVQYNLFGILDDMTAEYERFRRDASVPRDSGDCKEDIRAEHSYTYEGGGGGRVFCYRSQGTESWIEWTDERTLIYSWAWREDLNDRRLYGWWFNRAGPY
jgi:hypothetical protein